MSPAGGGGAQRRGWKSPPPASNHIHFPLQLYLKFFQNRSFDLLTQLINLPARSIAVIHQHERLLFVNTRISFAIAFPTALFDQPASGDFNESVPLWISRYARMFLFQLIILLFRYRWILEKASGISNPGRVG